MKLGEQLFADSSYLFLCVPDPISVVVGLATIILQFWALNEFVSSAQVCAFEILGTGVLLDR